MLEASKKVFKCISSLLGDFKTFFAALLYSIPMELYFFAIENNFD